MAYMAVESKKEWLSGEGWHGGDRFEIDKYIPLYLKWMTNKDRLFSTGNYAQCYVAAWMGGGFRGEQIYV